MANPIVTVWGGTQLLGATMLPQFNQTSGMTTRSIQIANDSDMAIVYRSERGLDIVISARYQLNAPLEANSQYQISLAAGQVGSLAAGQVVTVSESQAESTYSTTPLTQQASFLGIIDANFTGTIVSGSAQGLTTWNATAAKPAIVAVHLLANIRGTAPGAAEARVQLDIFDDSTPLPNHWLIASVIVDETQSVQQEHHYSSPVTPALLDPSRNWAANILTTILSGTPGNLDVVCELEWVL